MNKLSIYISLLFIILISSSVLSQRVRRPFKVDGSKPEQIKQWVLTYGFNSNGVAPKKHHDPEIKPRKNKKNEPAVLIFKFKPFDAQQLCIIENFNPGAISKIVIGYQADLQGKLSYKSIYEGSAEAKPKEWNSENYYFETLPNVQEVILTMDYLKVDGVNQIGGVILTDFKDKFEPRINIPDEPLFENKSLNMNDDVSGKIYAQSTLVSANGEKIFFSYTHNNTVYDKIAVGEIGSDGKFKKVSVSVLNLPSNISAASGLAGLSQDNNVGYVNDMSMTDFKIFKVYENRKGVIKYKKDSKISGLYLDASVSNHLNYNMSYDGKVIIASFVNKKEKADYHADLHVSFKNEKGKWSKFQRMSDDINTTLEDLPVYIAPDNKTIFFASSGHNGYGRNDLFMTQRLDDTWLNWSYPINLGNIINTEQKDRYITFDTYKNYAYVTRDGDIFRYKMRDIPNEEADESIAASKENDSLIKKSVTKVNQPRVDPTILVDGVVLDKKTQKPVQADIVFYDINSKKELGSATSSYETGKYSIILRKGMNYSFEALADNYMSQSYNIDLTQLKNSKIVKQDIELTPILEGESLRLNIIFFETASYELKPESYLELDKLVSILQNNKKMKIEIQGYTDNVGKDQYNLNLSKNRAKSVVDYLLLKNISSARLSFKGYGKEQPVADNNTEEGRALNRRVEMKILEN